MKNKGLWIKLFETDGKKYCYDIETNNIIEVDAAMYFVLEHFGFYSQEEVLLKSDGEFPSEKINDAFEQIKSYQDTHAGFKTKKNVCLDFPFSKDEYLQLTENLVRHVILNITEDCNFRCRYCKYTDGFEYSRRHIKKSMPMKVIKKSIDFLVKRSSYYLRETDLEVVLGFYGGEPLLEANKIFDAIEYIRDEYGDIFSRFSYSLTTNCSCLTEPIVQKLIKYDVSLLLSLDGPENLNDRYRLTAGGSGSFNLIQGGINRIRELDPEYFRKNVGFSVVCSPEYKLQEVVDFFQQQFLGENRVYRISLVNANDTTCFNRFDLKSEREKLRKDETALKEKYVQHRIEGKYDAVLFSLFDRGINQIHHRYVFQAPEKIFPNGICLPGLQKVLVDTEGNFHICEKIDWNLPIGNLEKGFDVDNIYSLIDQYLDTTENCSDCWAIRFCTDCYLSAIDGAEFSKQAKEKRCNSTRTTILENMKLYVRIVEKNSKAFKMEREDDVNNVMQAAYKFLGRI